MSKQYTPNKESETSINWRHYTVGFCFSQSLRDKAKPEWQKGKLNGVGGSFEAGNAELNF